MAFSRLFLASLLGVAAAQPAWVPSDFRSWASENGQQYRSENEWLKAYRNYQDNEHIIAELNANAEDSAVYAHSKFSDLSTYEWKAKYFGITMSPEEGKRGAPSVPPALTDSPAPDAIDWRTKGAVTPVKDQSACGSCWAESAVGNMEGKWAIANAATQKAAVPLSTQQVLECDTHGNACYGGYPKQGYQYVIEHGGLDSAADYPYNVDKHAICLANQTFNKTCGDGMCSDPPLTTFCDETCSDKKHKSVGHIVSWYALPTDEVKIAADLAQNGPVSVALDASGGAWGALLPWLKYYKKGIANPKRCTTFVDHAVLLVGYGVEDGQKYWIVKNSWGASWGDHGYFRIIRGIGRCGINSMATSSTAAKPMLRLSAPSSVVV